MKKRIHYSIRSIKPSEFHLLDTFLYEAIFQKDSDNLLPRSIISNPELQVYIKDFGKETDFCLVADTKDKIIGCVWARIIAGDIKGFGNIDENTPEFAVSVLKDFRGCGVGTALMKAMLELLSEKGFKKAGLAVQKDNYAAELYKKLGFKIIGQTEEEYLMVFNFNSTPADDLTEDI